jgi:hypothetical protein
MHIFDAGRPQRRKSAGPPQPRTIAEALQACHDTFQRHANDGAALEHVRSDVDTLCAVARRDKLPPERLLVELKHTLDTVPELDRLEPENREEVRSRVVQYAIREYFADASSAVRE